MSENKLYDWMQKATAEEIDLRNRMYEFENLFSDMLFQESSSARDYFIYEDVEFPIDKRISEFDFGSVWLKYGELGEGIEGQTNKSDLSITISPAASNIDGTLLHEMVHILEYVISECMIIYRDVLIWELYQNLRTVIIDLDDRIKEFLLLGNLYEIRSTGGEHDLLFFLKCFDLDLKMNFPLGTVMGYGYHE